MEETDSEVKNEEGGLTVASEKAESMKATADGEELLVDVINTGQNVKMNEVSEQTLERQTTSPPQQEDKEDEDYEEYKRLLQELRDQREEASQRSSLLQGKLQDFFQGKAGDDAQLDQGTPVSNQQLQQYEAYVNILRDLKVQLTADSESAEQLAEELRVKSQEKIDKAEQEWRAFMVHKQDVAVKVLSRRLGKQAAQAKVEPILATEELLRRELREWHLKNIKLGIRIHRLEAELRAGEEHATDPLQLQFELLQAQRQKQNEEGPKIEKKICRSLVHLAHVREKQFCIQMEVKANHEELAQVEAAVARKRDLLTRTRQACIGLQKDNQRLKEELGLLGNMVLLRDFEDTLVASDSLEKQLEDLKYRQAELVFRLKK